jgi:hypothetical protein
MALLLEIGDHGLAHVLSEAASYLRDHEQGDAEIHKEIGALPGGTTRLSRHDELSALV